MIRAITFTSQNTFHNSKKNQSSMEGGIKTVKPAVKPAAVNPVKSGLSTTAAWFGFGIILDRVTTFARRRKRTGRIIPRA